MAFKHIIASTFFAFLFFITILLSIPPVACISVGFGVEECGEFVDLSSDYDVDKEVSVYEEATASYDGPVKIDDFRSLSGPGHISTTQSYSTSSGHTGSATFQSRGLSASLSAAATLTPSSVNAGQQISGSIVSGSASMSLNGPGSSAATGCDMYLGPFSVAQTIKTGSIASLTDVRSKNGIGSVWSSSSFGNELVSTQMYLAGDLSYSWARGGAGEIPQIQGSWSSLDGQHSANAALSGTGYPYSLSGSAVMLPSSVYVSQSLGIKNGAVNSPQSAEGSANGELLSSSSSLTASGSMSGLLQAASSGPKSFSSQQLLISGDALASSSAGAGPDSSANHMIASGANSLTFKTFGLTYNNLWEGQTVHRSQAGGDAIGKADFVSADAVSSYLNRYSASSHGQWTKGIGDLNIGSKTVKSALADIELTTNGNAAETKTLSQKDDMVMSGLKSTVSSGDGGHTEKFQSHLYSHSYPAYTYHSYDDVPDRMPLNWEEFYSTASGGVQGEGSSADVSRWEGGWVAAGSYQPNAGESNTFRATDITTTLPGSLEWDTIFDGIVRTRTPDEQVPWGIEYMYSNPDLAQTSGGRGVDVAVIDTGVDTLHPDLTMRIEDYFDLNSVGYEYQKGRPDGYGHGTHVSGTIAADGGFDGQGIWGMAPKADLKEYRVFDENGNGYDGDFIYAPFRAVDLGADIISMSYGGWGYDFPPEVDAMSYAAANGVLLVASAGNGLPAGTPTIGSPASYPDMVSVGAINKNGQAVWWTSSGYNNGDGRREANEVMFAAPGYQVLSTIPTYFDKIDSQDKNGGWKMASNYPWYASWPGTSMASPHISGTAAKTLSEGLYNGAGISESNADYVKGVLQSYAGGHAITQATSLDPWVGDAAYYRTRINAAAKYFAGTPPGDYYKALYDAILKGEATVTIPGNANDNCLSGLGVPRLPAGST